MFRALLCISCGLMLLSGQEPQPSEPAPTPSSAAASSTPGRPNAFAVAQEPQPYEKVITKDAKSKAGLFTVHQVKDKYYYEIPKGQLRREFLWVTQIARTTSGNGYGGQALGSRVVRWDRSGNRIYLRELNYETVADAKSPIARAVEAGADGAADGRGEPGRVAVRSDSAQSVGNPQ